MTDTHTATIVAAPHDAPERMHPLVALAMKTGIADPATLREMLTLQREWEAGEARKSYSRALASLKRDLPTVIAKDGTVDYASAKGRTRYTHATLAGAMAAVTEPLTRNGFSLSWIPSTGERDKVRVTCRLTHADGHHEECSLDAPADTSGSKSPAQAIASTITLLERYTALALLGIATADMKEPTGAPEAAPEAIDTKRNLRAAKKLAELGVPLEEVVAHIGRGPDAWTEQDRQAIGAYVETRKARERGEDPNA